MRRFLLVTALALSQAASAGESRARALAKDAEKLYRDNQYKEAAEKLREAYKLEPTAVYLFNIARALDQAGELQASLDAYRQYVSLPSDETQPEQVKRANLAMDRLRTLLAREEAQKEVRGVEKKHLEDEARTQRERADTEAEKGRAQKAAFEAKERAARQKNEVAVNGRKVAALVSGGAAVVAFGLAVGFGVAATGSKRSFLEATLLSDKRTFEADTRSQALVSDVCLLVGLAATTAAILLFPKGGDAEGTVSVALMPIQGGVMSSFGVRF